MIDTAETFADVGPPPMSDEEIAQAEHAFKSVGLAQGKVKSQADASGGMTEDRGMVERAVLGGILNVDGILPLEVLDLEVNYFSEPNHPRVFAAIRDLIERREPVDIVTVSDLLRKWDTGIPASFVCELAANEPFTTNLDHWCRLLIQDGRRRDYLEAAEEALKRARSSSGSIDEMAAALHDAVRNVQPLAREESTLIRDHISSVRNQLIAEHENPGVARIAVTGLYDLDRKATLSPAQMTIIAGRPGMGKSSLAGNVAAHCAKESDRGAVVVFSLEMSTHDLIRRMMASESRFPSSKLPEAAAGGELDETCERLYHLNLHINQQPHVNIGTVRSFLSRRGKIRLVVFDYLQLAEMDRNQERHDLKVGAMTKGLKAVAKDFACHVIVLSQLNRAVEMRTPPNPRLSDLRDSGNLEEDADNVWLLYRPYTYDKTASEHLAQLNIAKQRHGTTGEINLWWDGPTQTFRNVERHRERAPTPDWNEPKHQEDLLL
jgi:replicative DNA helicase